MCFLPSLFVLYWASQACFLKKPFSRSHPKSVQTTPNLFTSFPKTDHRSPRMQKNHNKRFHYPFCLGSQVYFRLPSTQANPWKSYSLPSRSILVIFIILSIQHFVSLGTRTDFVQTIQTLNTRNRQVVRLIVVRGVRFWLWVFFVLSPGIGLNTMDVKQRSGVVSENLRLRIGAEGGK